MYHIKPLRPNVTDPATGHAMPSEGVQVATLYPADHLALRQGDVSIEAVPRDSAVKTPLASEKQKLLKQSDKPKP